LIAPSLALTAAHCVDGTPPNASELDVFAGQSMVSGGRRVAVTTVVPHPAFDSTTYVNDIAVIRLAEPMDVTPWPVRSAPLDPTLVGHDARFVGYSRGIAGDPQVKHEGRVKIDAIYATKFRTVPNPSQPCFNDSGGPIFVTEDGRETLAGIVSTGDENCARFTKATRVDVQVAGFLQPFLRELESPAVPRRRGVDAGEAPDQPNSSTGTQRPF
jgi:secreted trypsin-like serine protease